MLKLLSLLYRTHASIYACAANACSLFSCPSCSLLGSSAYSMSTYVLAYVRHCTVHVNVGSTVHNYNVCVCSELSTWWLWPCSVRALVFRV